MKQRKDGRWVRVVTMDGKRHSFYSNADTESKAEKDIRRQIMDFKESEEKSMLFSNVAEGWERNTYDGLAHGTIKAYKPTVRELCDHFGSFSCSSITAMEITQYFNMLAINGYSAKTIQRRRSVMNLIFKYAIGIGAVGSNPVPGLSLPKRLKKETRRALTEAEKRIVLENRYNGYWGFWAYFVLSTGCRRGEAFAITYKDINFDERTLSIHRTIEHIGNVGVIKNHTKTDAGMRRIPLTDDVVSYLKQKMKSAKDLVFPDPITGGIISNDHITTGWDSYKVSVGLDLVTPHMFRHSYATFLYDADVDIKTAQYLLGHADMQTTLKIYTHLTEERRASVSNEVREKLTASFG